MMARGWFIKTVGLTVSLVIVIACVNAAIDPFGIFRNPQGRRLFGCGDDRVAKYLLSERYVPANFNAVLIGSSVSANWDASGIDGFRVYNESLSGANIVEEKAIVDKALAEPRIKLALFVVHPYMTSSHDFQTVHLTPHERVGALGSQNLLEAYSQMLKARFHKARYAFDVNGTLVFRDTRHEMNATLDKVMDPSTGFKTDPIALQADRDLLSELHAAHIAVVFVVPPISQALLASRSPQLAAYTSLILRDEEAGDEVIDFTSDEYADFRNNDSYFVDGVHVTRPGSRVVVSLINRQLDVWVRSGQLNPGRR